MDFSPKIGPFFHRTCCLPGLCLHCAWRGAKDAASSRMPPELTANRRQSLLPGSTWDGSEPVQGWWLP